VTEFEQIKSDYYHRLPIDLECPVRGNSPVSDTVLHLPVLEYFASLCQHVTEFGVREGHSTVALMAGVGQSGEVHSYDIVESQMVTRFRAITLPCKWHFYQGNTADPNLGVAETDFLYVDTLHTYEHVSRELSLWGRKARKFLAFHDTFTCGMVDASGPNRRAKGILPAIEEFLASYPGEYTTAYRTDANNGLWILQRAY